MKDGLNMTTKEMIKRYTGLSDPFMGTYGRSILNRFRSFVNGFYGRMEFKAYSRDIIDRLNERGIIERGKALRDKLWSLYDPTDKSEFIRILTQSIGYHDLIKPFCKVIDVGSKDKRGIQRVEFLNRFRIKSYLYLYEPIGGNSKGVVICLHGKSSSPERIFGFKKGQFNEDIALLWMRRGYSVIAPKFNTVGTIEGFERFSYSRVGADVAQVMDIIDFATLKYDNELPLILIGFSYGGHIAEIVSVISHRADALISSCASARGDYFVRLMTGDRRVKAKDLGSSSGAFSSAAYNFYFNGIGIFKLIAPKPLVISIGAHDHGEDKFQHIFEAVDFYKKHGWGDRIGLNVYKDGHKVDGEGDYSVFMRLAQKRRYSREGTSIDDRHAIF